MNTLSASLKRIKLTRVVVPAMVITAVLAILAMLQLSVPSVVQAADRLIKITTLEPGTEREGTCEPPVQRGEPVDHPLPPELANLEGYTQECEENAGNVNNPERKDLL